MITQLGINVDHVATLRQARRESFPSPVQAAQLAVEGGAKGITAHLREDRRHIQDRDVFELKEKVSVPFNLEMAANPDVVSVAKKLKPHWACLVPEKREELTTEGGLNVSGSQNLLKKTIQELQMAGIQVSLFIDPNLNAVETAADLGAQAIEIHTGTYSQLWNKTPQDLKIKIIQNKISPDLALNPLEAELDKIKKSAQRGRDLGLVVNAGHGIDYDNVRPLLNQFPFNEFNIGFSIVAKSVFVGFKEAVSLMCNQMRNFTCVES